jgi:hypothetical protein
MLGIVKLADALRCVGVILDFVIVLISIPGVLLSGWSGMSLWQWLALPLLNKHLAIEATTPPTTELT